jgi:hypothetical protein
MPAGFFHFQAPPLTAFQTAFSFSDNRFAGAKHFIKGYDLCLLGRNRQVFKCLSYIFQTQPSQIQFCGPWAFMVQYGLNIPYPVP